MGMDASNMGREDRSKGPEVEVYLAIQTYYLKKKTHGKPDRSVKRGKEGGKNHSGPSPASNFFQFG